MIDLQIELFWIYFWENLTDRSVRDVNETSNNVAHLIFVTKWLVGTGVYFSYLTFTIGIIMINPSSLNTYDRFRIKNFTDKPYLRVKLLAHKSVETSV